MAVKAQKNDISSSSPEWEKRPREGELWPSHGTLALALARNILEKVLKQLGRAIFNRVGGGAGLEYIFRGPWSFFFRLTALLRITWLHSIPFSFNLSHGSLMQMQQSWCIHVGMITVLVAITKSQWFLSFSHHSPKLAGWGRCYSKYSFRTQLLPAHGCALALGLESSTGSENGPHLLCPRSMGQHSVMWAT